jgi:hypothetical protein
MTFESLEQANLFHKQNKNNWIGEALAEYKHDINKIIKEFDVKSILDYGCGKAEFQKYIFEKNLKITNFDPAYEEFSKKPVGFFDLVLCIDVMEHIEESKVEEVFADIFSYSNKVFLTISCYPAIQTLPNGKNAHYTIKEPNWWENKLKPYENKYTVIFQVKPERSKLQNLPEEWKPNKITIERIQKNINDKRLDPIQIEKYLSNTNPRS